MIELKTITFENKIDIILKYYVNKIIELEIENKEELEIIILMESFRYYYNILEIRINRLKAIERKFKVNFVMLDLLNKNIDINSCYLLIDSIEKYNEKKKKVYKNKKKYEKTLIKLLNIIYEKK
jgi:alkyl sulfatase BDS1-like metallo-beta-lactamase superfamily hydrolase